VFVTEPDINVEFLPPAIKAWRGFSRAYCKEAAERATTKTF